MYILLQFGHLHRLVALYRLVLVIKFCVFFRNPVLKIVALHFKLLSEFKFLYFVRFPADLLLTHFFLLFAPDSFSFPHVFVANVLNTLCVHLSFQHLGSLHRFIVTLLHVVFSVLDKL